MYELNQKQRFRINTLSDWCLVNCIKINRSGDQAGRKFVVWESISLFRTSFVVLSTPDPFINLLILLTMTKPQVKSNIVYDPANDRTWNMQGFFETLEMYYEGKPETMAEDLVQAVKTLTNSLIFFPACIFSY